MSDFCEISPGQKHGHASGALLGTNRRDPIRAAQTATVFRFSKIPVCGRNWIYNTVLLRKVFSFHDDAHMRYVLAPELGLARRRKSDFTVNPARYEPSSRSLVDPNQGRWQEIGWQRKYSALIIAQKVKTNARRLNSKYKIPLQWVKEAKWERIH